MRVTIHAATTRIDEKTRSAFSDRCLDDLARQLNDRPVTVNYGFREASIAGWTIPGTAAVEDHDLRVEADLAPAWWTAEELASALPILGGACGGKMLEESTLYGVHVVERVKITAVALVPLATSCNPQKPVREATP